MITQDNINEELDNALQREREAKLLLQEYERRLQDLNNRLEMHSSADKRKSQDPKAAPMVRLFFWNSHQHFTSC